ncbi:MAG TPA: hypothetical protein VFL91_12520 [Thermomicrobiales bacterium]|nr:hypothetical protein [Thermomicrobiales bacterium]
MPRPIARPPRTTCFACHRRRGAGRPALVADIGAGCTMWLCDECAGQHREVAAFVATYERIRGQQLTAPGSRARWYFASGSDL